MVDKARFVARRVSVAAFTLIELLVVVAVIALLVALSVPTIARAIEGARTAVCQTQMRTLGQTGYIYAQDHDDIIFALTADLPQGLEFVYQGSMAARRFNAQQIILERLGVGVTLPGNIEPINYTYLVLYDYLLEENIEKLVACPSDRYLQQRQEDARRPLNASDPTKRFEGFASSYYVVPATITGDFDGLIGMGSPYLNSIDRDLDYARTRELSEVANPSAKVWMFEPFQFHFGPKIAYAHEDVRQPLLMFDGSVNIKQAGDSQLGYLAMEPDSTDIQRLFNGRLFIEPDDVVFLTEERLDPVYPRYLWTRDGLRGRDF